MRKYWLVLMLAIQACVATATTITVRKDGTGDYTMIQPAVDHATTGDTIRIGPGRYDDKQLFGNPPWQQYVRILVTTSGLTIIGAGPTSTIVGPALLWTDVQDQDKGIYLTGDVLANAPSLRVQGIRFENSYSGIHAETSSDALRVQDCEFQGNTTSIDSFCRTTEIDGCRFSSLAEATGSHVNAIGQDSLRIRHSVFVLEARPYHIKVHLNAQSTALAMIADCEFRGGMEAASVSNGTRGEFRRCLFEGQSVYGVATNVVGVLLIEDSVMRDQSAALYASGPGGTWMLDRVLFADIRDATLDYGNLGGGYIHNCTLAKGARYVVRDVGGIYPVEGPTPLTFDMSDNWWGSSDPDSIQAWIYDSFDQPARPYYYIQWSPYRSEPLATQQKNFGDVRAMFR